MKTVRLSWILFIFLFLAGSVRSREIPNQDYLAGRFSQANSEYQKGNYAPAEQIYLRILASGVDSGPLYFNLGNACYKQKRLGDSIYYWEKALQKSPGDHDARENLELANLMIVDRVESPADPFSLRVLNGALGLLTTTQAGWLTIVLFFIANGLFAFYLLVSNRLAFHALIGSLVIGILFVVLGCSFLWKTYDRDYRKQAIVVEQKVDVRSGPGFENMTVFPIHEGLKIRVHDSSNGWRQISLPNGWTGWLRDSDIRIL
jgi:tetratricopeptide (TPR) repeat protein